MEPIMLGAIIGILWFIYKDLEEIKFFTKVKEAAMRTDRFTKGE